MPEDGDVKCTHVSHHMCNLILIGSALSLTIQSLLDDLRIAENAVYLHLCQRISSLELSSVFPLKGCHKSGEDNRSFYFLLERWIWEPFPRLGTEKVWILNPRIVFKIRPNLNKLIWMFSVCFSLGAVETIRFGRLHNVFLASCFFFPRSRHISELKKWAACQIVGSSSSCNRDICKQSVTGALASTFDAVRISATDCY